MGGIGSLPMDYGQSLQVPQQMQPSFSSAQNITMNPLLNYGQTPLTMANGGSANLVEREKYGFGSKLKKFVRNIIPNEVAEIAVKAAPFVAPFNPLLAGAMAGIGGFDQTGRIGSSLKSAALTYGAGQIARGIGGAGFQGGFDPFAGYSSAGSFGGVGSLFTSPMGNLPFGSFSTPTQLDLTGAGTDYGINEGLRTTTPSGVQNLDVSGAGTDYGDTLGARTTSNVPFVPKEQGYMDLLKKAGSLENVPLSERFNAVKDLSSKALTDLFTKPIPGQPGKTQLDKTALYATFAGASSYIEARKLANKAGVPESEFNEADYQRLNIDPEKAKLTNLKAENFGIRKAEGGRIGYGLGGMIQKLIQQNPEMFRPAQVSSPKATLYQTRATDFIDENEDGIDDRQQAAGGGLMNEGVLSIKLTPAQAMAMGGRIGYQVGGISGLELNLNPSENLMDGLIYRYTNGRFQNMQDYNQWKNQLSSSSNSWRDSIDPVSGQNLGSYVSQLEDNIGSSMVPQQQQQQQRQPVQYQYSDKGTMIEQFGYQPEQLTPELQAQINQYKNALNRVESSYGKKFSELSGPEQMTNPGAYGQTGGMPFTANQYLSKAYQSEQDAAARVTPKKAKGGKINYPMGNEIPVRQNQGGISELDLRAKGGYIPVGIKEKADDVPAMLSRNEFVFTADAVRGAGNGSINKGAQKMYKLMKSLEKKVKQNKVA
jgi:hypothetical protein